MNQRSEVEKIAKTISPKLKTIDPGLKVSVEKRRIEPLKGQSYIAWVLMFKAKNVQFSMDPTVNINSIRKAFLNASSNSGS